jgi:DNA-binding CsgD family transcriptional regulator
MEGRGTGRRREGTQLTDRENEIFRLIGEGLSMTAIADKLSISVLTARTHRRNIISKLGISGSRLVVYAAEKGRTKEKQPG